MRGGSRIRAVLARRSVVARGREGKVRGGVVVVEVGGGGGSGEEERGGGVDISLR